MVVHYLTWPGNEPESASSVVDALFRVYSSTTRQPLISVTRTHSITFFYVLCTVVIY